MKILKEETAALGFPYIAYIPEKLSETPALLIQLHGAGERGNGGADTDKVLVHGIHKVATDENLKDCIIIMPQCPEDTFWAARVESIKRFIDNAKKEYNIDESRIYLCGLSMGGYGTWYTAMAYPELFAAIAPCCGGGMAWNAGVLKMPIRCFHGLDDTVVLPKNTIEMKEALEGWHPDFKCELYEGVGHNSWERAFSEELLIWFQKQRKG